MKKFLSYVLTFFIMFFMSAGVTVWFSYSRGNNGIVDPGQSVGGASGSSFFTQLLDTFSKEKSFKIKGDLDINYNDMELPLFVDVNIDINDTNNIKLEGIIIIEVDGNDVAFDFVYHSNVLYLAYNEVYIKLAVDDISGIIETIKTLIPINQIPEENSNSQNSVQTPEQNSTQSIDFNKLLDQYMPVIMAALNNIEEQELENGDKKFTLKLEGLVEAGMICNSEEILKSVELQTANLNGLQVNANLSIKFDKTLEVTNPSQDEYFNKYLDITNALEIVKNTLAKQDLNLFASVKIDENSVGANLGYDFKSGNIKATLINNSYGFVDKANIVYVDGNLYIDVNNIKILITEQMIEECSPLLKNVLKDINIEEILGLSKKTTEIISRVETLFDGNIASILAIVQNIELTNSHISLKFDSSILGFDIGILNISVSIDSDSVNAVSIKGLEIDGQEIEFNAELKENIIDFTIENKEEYLDIYNLYNQNKYLFDATQFDVSLIVEALIDGQEKNMSIDALLSKEFVGIDCEIVGNLYNELEFIYKDGYFYVGINDAKVKLDANKIFEILNSFGAQEKVQTVFDSFMNQISEKSQQLSITDILSILYIAKDISISSDGIELNIAERDSGLSGDIKIFIDIDQGKIKSVFVQGLEFNESKIDVQLVLNKTTFVVPEINEEDYLNVSWTLEKINSILSTTNGTITLKADIGYGEQEFNIDLSLCGSLEEKFAKIVLALNGTYDLDLNASYYNEKLYANMGEAFISVDLEYILGLLGMAKESIDVEEIKNQITSTNIDIEKIYIVQNLITFIKGIKYEDLRKVNIVANANGLTLTLDKSILNTEADFVLSISFLNDNVTNLSFTKVNITEELSASLNLTIDVTPVTQEQVEVEEEKYLDVKTTIERVKNILSTTNGTITLKADVGYGEQEFSIDLSLCGSIEEKFAKIVLALNGTYDLDLNVNYYNDKLFANMGEAFISVDLEYILGLLGMAKESIDVEEIKNQITSTNIDIEKIYIVKNLITFIKGIKYEDLSKIKVVANSSGVSLTLDKSILNTEADFVLSIIFVNDNVTNLSFTKVNITEELSASLNLTIDVTPVTQEQVEVEEEKYLDVKTTIERVKDILSTTNGTITLKADIGYGEQEFNIDLSLCGSIEEKFAKVILALNGTYDLDLNASYYNEKLYANMGEAFVSVDLEYILGLLGMAQEKVDVNALLNEVKNVNVDLTEIYIIKNVINFVNNISYEDLRKVNIVANANGLTLTLDKSILNTEADFVLSISFLNDNVTNISFTKVNITEELSASMSLTIDTTPVEQFAVEVKEEKYLDVKTTIERVKDILSMTNGTITLKADVGYGEQEFSIDLSLCGSIEEKFAKIVLALNGTYDLDLNVNYYNDKLFANMGEAFISVDLEYIFGLLGMAKESIDVEEIKDITSTNIDIEKIYIVKNLMTFIKGIKYEDLSKIKVVANSSGISLTLDKSILGTEADFVLSISFLNHNVTNISFTKVNITEELSASLNLTIDVTPVTQEQVEVEEEKYLDVKTTIERVKNILSTTNGTITLKADVGYGEQEFNIDLSLCGSIEEKFAKVVLALNGTYDLDLNASYYNEKLYANMGEAFVSVDLEYILGLLGMAKESIDVEEIKNITSTNIDIEKIYIVKNLITFIKGIKYEDLRKVNIVANANGLTLTLDKSVLNTKTDFVLSISFVNDNVTNISFTNVNITEELSASLNLTIDVTPVTQEQVEVEEEKYLDVKTTIERVKNILSTTNGTITLKADVGYGEQEFNIDLSLCGSIEEKFAKVVLALNGTYDLDLNANYYNDKLFANMGDIFVSIDLQTIKDIIEDLTQNDDSNNDVKDETLDKPEQTKENILLIENVLKFINNFEIEDLYKFNLTASEKGLQLVVDKSILGTEADFVLSIIFVNDNVTNVSFTKVNITEELSASLNLTIDVTPVTQEQVEVEEEKYLDVKTTIERVKNILSTTKGTIALKADIGYGEQEFNIDLSLCGSLEEKFAKIVLALNGTYDLDLNANYYNEKLYANMGEAFVSVDIEYILGLLGMAKESIDVEEIKNQITSTNIDIEKIYIVKNLITFIKGIKYEDLRKVNIVANANGLTLTLDKSILNTEADFVLSISFLNHNVTNISFTKVNITEELSASMILTIDTTTVEQSAVEVEEEKYLDVKTTIEKVKDILSTTNGTITLKADVGYGEQEFNIDLSLCGSIEEKFAKVILALNGTYDLDLNASYYNEKLYANMGEAFISVDLEYILGLLGMAKESIDVEEIKNQITSTNIDIEKIYIVKNLITFIKGIKYEDLSKIKVVANSSGVSLILDKPILNTETDFVLSISFVNDNVTNISFTKVNITEELSASLNLTIDVTPVTQEQVEVEEEKYLDVKTTIEKVKDILSTTNGTITLKADVGYGEQEFNIDLSLCGSIEEKFAKVILALNGTYDLDLGLNYYDNKAFISFEDILVSVGLKDIKELLAEFKVDLDQTIQNSTQNVEQSIQETEFDVKEIENIYVVKNLLNFVKKFKYEDLSKIKIVANSSGVSLTLDKSVLNTETDFVLSISFVNDNVTNISFTKVNITEELSASMSLTIDTTPVEKEQVVAQENNYLDIGTLLDNIEEIIDGKNLWLDLEASLFTKENEEYLKEMGLNLDFRKQLVGVDLKLYALIEYMYKEYSVGAEIKYNNSTLFASVLGLNVKIENGRIIDTVHSVLDLFMDNVNAYDDILGMIVDILDGKSIIQEIKQFTKGRENIATGETTEEQSSSITIDYKKLFNEIVNNVSINSNVIDVSFNLECLGLEGVVDATITLSGGKIVKIEITKLKIKDRYLDANLSIDYSFIEEFPVVNEEEQAKYIDLAETAGLVEATIETLQNKTISGQITVMLDKNGEIDAVINYGVKMVEGKLEAYLTTTFKGVPVDIRYKYDTFYLDIVGLKIYLEFKSINDLIDWINDEFGTDINFSTDVVDDIQKELNNLGKTVKNFNLENVMKNLSSIDLGFINYVKFTQNMAEVLLADDYKLNISYGSAVDSVELTIKDKYLIYLTCSEYDDFTNKNIYPVGSEYNVYKPYTELIELYDSVMATIKQKQFDITANAKAYKEGKETYNVDIFDFALDFTDGLNAYGSAVVTGETNVEFDAAYKDDKLYVNYDGLKLAMSFDAIKELLVIVLDLVGLDPTTIGFLKDVAGEMKVNTENLGNYLPGMDFDNPLNSIKHIKNISFNNGMFSITIDGKLMNPEATTYMDIVIGTNGGQITSASVNNFFTGTSDERFDLMVNLNDYKGVKELTDQGSYIDLSDATDLIKAFINTSNLHDYHVNGKIKLAIIGIDNIAAIDVDAQIKSDEEGNVVAAIELNNYPLVGLVNGGNTNGLLDGALATFRKRSISLYFDNNTVYLKTVDEKTTFAKQYNRITKVQAASLLDNIGYYIQWLLGFKDTIQAEIDQAIYESTHFTGKTDMGNILKEYNLESDGRHKIVINLGEIAHTSDIGNATLHIATTKVTEQEKREKEDGTIEIVDVQKDYVYSLDLGLEMLDGTISLNTDTDNKLYLVDIGKEVNVSSAVNFINKYPYNLDAEYKKEGTMDSSNPFSGFSQTNANTVYITFDTDGGNAISQMSGTIGANLTLPTPTKVVNGTSYQFVGWFYQDGKECTLTSYPRDNVTLYARWFKYRLSFEVNGGFEISTIEAYQGTEITLPTPTKYVDRGDMRTYYTFEGWFLNPEFEGNPISKVTLNDHTTVYAKWREERKAETRTLYVYSNGKLILKERFEIGAQIVLPEGIVGSTEIIDKKKVDYSVYKCTGWDKEVTVMGNKEITVTAVWELVKYKKYYKINFVVDWYDPANNGVSYDNLDTKPDTSAIEEEYWILEGETFSIPEFNITAQDKYGFLNLSKRNYKVVGWKTTPASYGSTAEYTTSISNVSSNMTLYAVWQKV